MYGRNITKKATQQSAKAEKLIAQERLYGCHNYKPINVVIAKAKGLRAWDVDGKEYIDCLSGYSAVNQGHCHPKIKQAMIEQMDNLTLISRAFFNDKLGPWTEYVCKTFNYDRVYFANSGVEGGESAVKFARRWAYDVKGVPDNQARVLFANNNFWGRSLAACASSNAPDRYARFGPFQGMGFDLIDFNDPEALDKQLASNPNYAAFMVEPIQGEAGFKIPDAGYLKRVREICDKHNVLLIFDEVQTGLGRTGQMLAGDWEGVKPDILVLGKSLSGGFYPISACLTSNEVMDCIGVGEHGSTYGGNPLACVVGQAALEVIQEEGLVYNSRVQGAYLLEGLKEFDHSFIREARGKGMMLALEFDPEWEIKAAQVCDDLMHNGMLCKQTHGNTIRISPPLIATREDCDQILEILNNTINKY